MRRKKRLNTGRSLILPPLRVSTVTMCSTQNMVLRNSGRTSPRRNTFLCEAGSKTRKTDSDKTAGV